MKPVANASTTKGDVKVTTGCFNVTGGLAYSYIEIPKPNEPITLHNFGIVNGKLTKIY